VHELSVALGIVDVAAEEAARRGVRVAAVHVRLGALAGVVRQALEAAYELAREGSPLAGAALVVEEVAAEVYCPACAARRPAAPGVPCCAACGGPPSEVLSGRELEVVALEVEG
jgi:hydrogenase nickel incorporation protein HypA/HybF